jgi:hypothetical protein
MGVLSCVGAVPGGKPFEPFGKDSICSEGGSTGRRADWPCHINIADTVKLVRPSVQLPAGDPRMARFIRILAAKARESGPRGDIFPAGREPAAA